jgi:N6-L-threonylcarbamoyladenine synthase
MLKKLPEVSETKKKEIAKEFEDAVAEVLWKKTARALERTCAATLVIGGGVSANTHIRRVFKENMASEFSQVDLRIPTAELTTDNAIMIALAGYYRAKAGSENATELSANGNLALAAPAE